LKCNVWYEQRATVSLKFRAVSTFALSMNLCTFLIFMTIKLQTIKL
jgi:hypothetical protein